MKVYKVEVEFSNEGEIYGREEYYIEALSDADADDRAFAFARDSHYDDDRIPDRSVDVSTEEVEDHEIPEGAVLHRMVAAPQA